MGLEILRGEFIYLSFPRKRESRRLDSPVKPGNDWLLWFLKRYILFFSLICLFPAGGFSAENDFKADFSGDLTHLASGSETAAGKEYVSNLSRLRLELSLRWMDYLSAFIAYDHSLLYSGFIKSPDFKQAQARQREQFFDQDDELLKRGNLRWEHGLYRSYVTYKKEDWEASFGRRQVSWGLGKFWAPTDLFNPFDPLSLEKDERRVRDNLRVAYFSPGQDSLEGVYVPARSYENSSFGLRLIHPFQEKEIGIILGELKKNEIAGLHFLTNIGKSALRLEHTFNHYETDFFKTTVNIDYTFSNSLYLMGEYYYNGQGRRDKSVYQITRWNSGEIDFLGQDYLGALVGYDLTPLIRAETYIILNIRDESAFINPQLKWSLSSNSSLLLGGQFFSGNDATEFERFHNLGYLRWRLFF